MTDTDKLVEIIKSKGLKLSWLAQQLNLSPYGFARKLHNHSEFKPSEIIRLCEELGISDEQIKDIFFNG